jgi:hypothetical protein
MIPIMDKAEQLILKYNGYVNQFKKDEIAKWAELMLKHGVIKMEGLNKNS